MQIKLERLWTMVVDTPPFGIPYLYNGQEHTYIRPMRHLKAILPILFMWCGSRTQDIPSIDSTVNTLMAKGSVAGLCLGIIRNGEVAYVKAYGYKNKPAGLLNDTATCFAAQSLSKVLFAYMVMQLVDKGVIDLDKPLYTYLPKPLPEYDNYKDLASDDRWKLLTARMCLDHTTGFPNWRQLNPHRNGKLEIFYDPGKHYAYSGEGIVLLQMVIETITGRSLEDLAREEIFQPFGMSRSSYFWHPEFANDFALGHNAIGDTLRRRWQNSANAAGSLETTIADYSRFMAAVLRKERVSSATWNQMITPQIAIDSKSQFPSLNTSHTKANKSIQLSYGLGWGLFYTKAGWAFFKEGHNDGWQHYTIAFPERKDAYLFLTNSDNGESIFKELVDKITGVTIPWRWEGYTD